IIALLVNPSDRHLSRDVIESTQAAARAIPYDIHVLNASTEAEIDAAFLTMAQLRPVAALIAADGFYTSQRHHIVALSARQACPVMYSQREFTAVGGLLSYGINYADAYRQGRSLCGPHSQGREADQPASRGTHQVRSGDQSQDRERARVHHSRQV